MPQENILALGISLHIVWFGFLSTELGWRAWIERYCLDWNIGRHRFYATHFVTFVSFIGSFNGLMINFDRGQFYLCNTLYI